jgi:hypothetical protein
LFYLPLIQAIKRVQLAQNQQKNAVKRKKEHPRAACFGSHFPASFLLHPVPDKKISGKMSRAVTFKSLLRNTERDFVYGMTVAGLTANFTTQIPKIAFAVYD